MPAEPGGASAPLDLSHPTRVHVVGVGGAGMSAIARVLAAMGHAVSGSDLRATPVTERLEAEGVTVHIGHQADHVGDARVVTSSPAVAPGNAELVEARRLGATVVARAAVLAAIAATRRTLAVAGTHGKTTTSSMLSLILVEAGLHPSFLIGADVNEIGTNAVWDDGEWLVVEADESYGTFTALSPEVALVTNIEADHLDHYGDFETLRQAFVDFCAGAVGGIYVCADDPVAAEVGAPLGARTVGQAAGADFRMADVTLSRSAVAFDLIGPAGPLGRLDVPTPGLHNARNAALAVAAALSIGAPFAAAATALARFAGVPRRFEFRGSAQGVSYVDDYAHLPTEVRAAVAAARVGGWGRVVVVFQPHRYTRTARLYADFATAFEEADVVVVTDVYGAGEPPVPGVSGRLVADAVRSGHAGGPGPTVLYAPGWAELRRRVGGLLRAGDLCLTLGAGDLTRLPDELMAGPPW
jgi:UDP-N-acetylmuramate--alanine ligase